METLKLQHISEGFGAKYHRIYRVPLNVSLTVARQAMLELKENLNQCCPQLIANFEKTSGSEKHFSKGDEYQIHITGPWNGPVRVTSSHKDGFTLKTLEGHLEAGEIIFRLRKLGPGHTVFEIESMARSRDRLVDLFYDKIPIAKAAQTQMWIFFCRTFAKNACGEDVPLEQITVHTERFDEDAGVWEQL